MKKIFKTMPNGQKKWVGVESISKFSKNPVPVLDVREGDGKAIEQMLKSANGKNSKYIPNRNASRY